MRIIAGTARGRRLVVPAGRGTRPTSDRAREGLFSTLESLRGASLAGARVLDLFAGSGAIGLEALSRGAAVATMVESDRRAVDAIRRNIAECGLDGAQLRPEPVERVLSGPPQTYDVVVADPPYDVAAEPVLAVLQSWLDVGSIVAVERSSRDAALCWPDFIEPLRERRYGEGTLWYGRRPAGEGVT